MLKRCWQNRLSELKGLRSLRSPALLHVQSCTQRMSLKENWSSGLLT